MFFSALLSVYKLKQAEKSKHKIGFPLISFADLGCLSWMQDPNFFHPGSASKNSNILTQKLFFIHPGSRSQKGNGSWIRIRNTASNFFMFLSQLKRELVVSCCGELIALHTEIANLIVDVASVVDTETQVVVT
jgi:hypothetical protein